MTQEIRGKKPFHGIGIIPQSYHGIMGNEDESSS